MKRLFLTGTARSGTTLLQSILHRSNEVFSPPETHFLDYTVPKFPLLRYSWIFGSKSVRKLSTITNSLELEFRPRSKNTIYTYPEWLRLITQILDHNALDSGYNKWLEKTPSHLLFVPDILRYTNANCIIIYREAKDNVAALYQASTSHPNYFRQDSIEKAFKRYQRDAKIIAQVAANNRCFLINYQDIINQNKTTLHKVFEFAELHFEKRYLAPKKNDISLIEPSEIWKKDNSKPIKTNPTSYTDRLTQAEKKELEAVFRGYKNPIDGKLY